MRPSPLRLFLCASCLLGGILLALRIFLAWHSPDFRFPDEHVYLDIARHVASDNRFAVSAGSPVYASRQAPGLPVTLGLLGKILPLSPLTAKLVNAAAFTAAAVLIAVAVWRMTRRVWPALCALALAGLHPALLYTSLTNYPQSFQAFWMAALALAWTWRTGNAQPSPAVGALDGALIGIGALFVPTQVFVAPAALAFHANRGLAWLTRYAACAALAGALVITPWTARNLVVEHALIPFSTNGGEQLYLGFNPQAGPNTGIQIALPDELSREIQAARSGKEAERVFTRHAVAWIRGNPARAGLLWVRKFLNFFRWDNGRMVTESERSAFREWIARGTSLGVFLLALTGAFRLRKSSRPWVIASIVLCLTLAAGHACFIARYRYRLPFEPFLILLGLAGLGMPGKTATPSERISS